MGTVNFRKNDTYRNMYDGFLQIRGHVNTVDELPVSGISKGDVYTVGDNKLMYIYNESWSPMGGSGGETAKHMVVYGTFGQDGSGDTVFVPNNGQPTFSEAVEAFESGIPVIISVSLAGTGGISSRVLCHVRSNGVGHLCAFIVEGFVSWNSDENADPGSDHEA